jgi:ADP-ribose pyrophosphatase YjhB (NUDIX family)
VEVPQRSTGIAGFVVPVDGDRVLLARHTYGPPVWGLLGGTALPDEAPDATARREVEEESGLQVTTERLVAVCDIGSLVMFIFAGRVMGGTERRQAEEIAELRWLDRDELLNEAVFRVVPLLLASLFDGQDGRGPGLSLRKVAWPDGTVHPVFMVE